MEAAIQRTSRGINSRRFSRAHVVIENGRIYLHALTKDINTAGQKTTLSLYFMAEPTILIIFNRFVINVIFRKAQVTKPPQVRRSRATGEVLYFACPK